MTATSRTVTHQDPLSVEFARQEYWNGLLFPPPGHLPSSEFEPEPQVSPALGKATKKPLLPNKCTEPKSLELISSKTVLTLQKGKLRLPEM